MNSNFYFNNSNFKKKIIHYPLGYPFKEKIISLSTRDSSYRHLILGYKKTCKQTGIFATYTVPICFVLLQKKKINPSSIYYANVLNKTTNKLSGSNCSLFKHQLARVSLHLNFLYCHSFLKALRKLSLNVELLCPKSLGPHLERQDSNLWAL